jgi:hypothetical protein
MDLVVSQHSWHHSSCVELKNLTRAYDALGDWRETKDWSLFFKTAGAFFCCFFVPDVTTCHSNGYQVGAFAGRGLEGRLTP